MGSVRGNETNLSLKKRKRGGVEICLLDIFMRFKKVYIEITNICNLNCKFCIGHNRAKESLDFSDFKMVLRKIKPYTNYLYFHLMGEPLLHPLINEFIDYASKDFKINITTNGYFIDRIKNNKNIRQINISLQAYDGRKLDYLDNILTSVENLLLAGTIVNYRVWNNYEGVQELIGKLEKFYNTKLNGNTKIKDNVYIDFATEFIWPDINNNYYNKNGSCLALKDHIGILVDGTVVPCCLDYNGSLALGNIYKESLEDIMKSENVKRMLEGFQNKCKIKEICCHCNFYDRIAMKKARDNNEG